MSGRANWLFRLHGAVAAAGLAVALASLGVAAGAVSLDVPSAARTLAACRSWLSSLEPLGLFVTALGALGAAVIVRTFIAALRLQRSTRRYLRSFERVEMLSGRPPVQVVADGAPIAFCAGLLRPQVYISTGALERLDRRELRAVLAHEAHHASCRDPLRLLLIRAVGDGLFFLPALRRMSRHYATATELAADEAAVRGGGGPQPLAAAMLVFGDTGDPAVVAVSAERVQHLCGERPPKLPVWSVIGGGLTVAVLVTVVIEGARATATAHFSLMLLLMRGCGPLMFGFASLVVASAIGGFVRR